jgi:hypothetical protein
MANCGGEKATREGSIGKVLKRHRWRIVLVDPLSVEKVEGAS